MMLVDRHGGIRGPESENVHPSRSRFRVLNPDGTLRDGPSLSGYYTSYPALDADGTAVFWRDGRLVTIDAAMQVRQLFARDDSRAVMSRILLLDNSRVTFALDNELITSETAGWQVSTAVRGPVARGNLQGNPAASL